MTDVRVTQGAIEALVEQARGTLKVTQGAVEVLVEQARGDVKLTQGAIEVMHDDITPLPEPPYSEELGALRVTQHSVSVLSSTDPDARTTQAAAMVMYAPGADARITQTPALVLHDVLNQTRITQTVALALVDQVCCHTRWTQILKITRTDGQIFAYTTHSKDIVWRGIVYQSCCGIRSTAREAGVGGSSFGTQEITGLLSDTGVRGDDVFYGLFDGAGVEINLVPWDNPNNESPVRLISGTIGKSSLSLSNFQFEVVTDAAQLQQRELLDIYTPGCRYKLGDKFCGVVLDGVSPGFEVIGTVSSVDNFILPNSGKRRIFNDDSQTQASGYFDGGLLAWQTGYNTLLVSEIKTFDGTRFELRQPLPNEIQPGDTYIATPGCNKSVGDCRDKFNNFDNFGGFPHVPGEDRYFQTPNAK